MKKRLLIFLLLIATFKLTTSFKSEPYVYLCDSETAHKYHYQDNCRGLNACKHTIIKVPLHEAIEEGRTLCGWEK